MKRSIGAVAMAVALVLAAAAGAQYPPPPPGAPPPPPSAAVQPLYPAPQLDQLLAGIALYPDPLLTAVLTAATYPLEIVDADRWLAVPGNAALGDGALAAALEAQNWDPSVKSLVPFPQILQTMDVHLDWTQAIGNAFLAQQADVMDAIQRLRHAALAAGTVVSSPDATVTVDGPYIEIEPAQAQFVAVPVYNPTVVYGAWPYPAYPPIYYGPPPGYGISATYGGLGFGIAIGMVDVLWNWGHWDWRDHDIRVDPDRFNRINGGRAPVAATVWQHDPAHRHAVPYADPRSRARYQKPIPGSPAERNDYRGYQPGQPQQAPQRPGTRRPAAAAPAAPTRPEVSLPPQRPGAARPAAPPSAAAPTRPQPSLPPPLRPAAPSPSALPRGEPQRQAPQQAARPVAPVPQRQAPQQTARPVAPVPQRPTAFQNLSPGPEAHAVSQRGQASRQSPPPRPAPARPPAQPAPSSPQARPAPSGPPTQERR